MKKDVTIIRCDGNGCKEYVEWEKSKVGSVVADAEHPAGWYLVKQVDEAGKLLARGFDFCSLRCIGKWSKGRENTGVVTPTAYDKKPCPSCGKDVSPQGFAAHWRTMHANEMSYEEAKQLFKEDNVAAEA